MIRTIPFYLLFFLICLGCQDSDPRVFWYPKIENHSKTEQHFGISYVNEYSNLEDLENEDVDTWYQKQDSVAEAYFASSKGFDKAYKHYEQLEKRETDPAKDLKYNESGLVFYLSSKGSKQEDDSDRLYRKTNYDAPGELLFDPETFKDGSYDIEYYEPSYDGKYVAIAMGKPENFFNDLIILDCRSKSVTVPVIPNTKPNKAGGVVWTPDSKCVTYLSYPNHGEDGNDRNSFTEMYCLGKEGTKVIFKDGLHGISVNPEYYPVPKFRSADSNYAFIYIGNASDHWDCYYLPTREFLKGNFAWKKLFSEKDKVLQSWGTERDHFYYYKRVNGDNIELCSVDLRDPDFANPRVLAAGKGEYQIGSFKIVKDHIYYTISTNGISETLYKYVEGGTPEMIELPFPAGEITLNYRSPYKNDLWVTLSGWTSNPKDYYLNNNGEFEFVELGKWPSYPEFDNIISEVVEVTSHDGTTIPLSIVRRKDFEFNAASKGIITAYGAYGMSETPWFHSPLADFVNQGNIYATAHIRGGGEKGPAWHEAGMKAAKENSWKDLIACSEFLIENKFVHPEKLALHVNSAGGIAGGMAVNERPDLYNVFTGFLPSLNVIRTEYMEDFDDSDTTFEFGTVKENQSYKDLLEMDPVLNLNPNKEYPSTLLIMGFNDYLIPPSDSGKYVALLQTFNTANDKPYLLDVKFNAEHEINWLDDYARMLYFTINELDQ